MLDFTLKVLIGETELIAGKLSEKFLVGIVHTGMVCVVKRFYLTSKLFFIDLSQILWCSFNFKGNVFLEQ